MRRLLVAAVALSSLLVPPPAGSHPGSHDIVFNASVPCHIACSYWPVAGSLGFTPCKDPFPPQSYADVRTEPAPTPPAGKKLLLVFEISPSVDWDTWICATNGDQLAQGALPADQPCDNFLGPENPVPVGCKEKSQTPATAGGVYVLRAYNWSDPAACPGKYTWVFI